MIVLGVDPGTLVTGYGVIEGIGRRIKLVEFGVVKTESGSPLPVRLKTMYDRISQVIKTFHPDEFATETAFYGRNVQTTMKIGYARGVAILAAVNYGIPTTEYSPREIKKAVTGSGAASKEQVRFMVRTLLNMKEAPEFYDASDALAVAICHISRLSSPHSKFRDWKSFIKAHPERVTS
jgi:crossover junction endodeoxyribonuclease RuvC